MCIALHRTTVEGSEPSFDIAVPPKDASFEWRLQHDPLRNKELMFRIQLLADRLIGEWNGKEGSGIDIRWEDRIRSR